MQLSNPEDTGLSAELWSILAKSLATNSRLCTLGLGYCSGLGTPSGGPESEPESALLIAASHLSKPCSPPSTALSALASALSLNTALSSLNLVGSREGDVRAAFEGLLRDRMKGLAAPEAAASGMDEGADAEEGCLPRGTASSAGGGAVPAAAGEAERDMLLGKGSPLPSSGGAAVELGVPGLSRHRSALSSLRCSGDDYEEVELVMGCT